MFIGALQKTTLTDFPGKVACIVFLVNCNFKCHYCYNKELTSFKFFKKGKRELLDEKDFFKFLESKKKMLDGVVITGGEPTMSPGLVEFIKKIKSLGFAVKLDTNGTNPSALRRLFSENLLDYVAMDIKAPLDKYNEITQSNVDSALLLDSIDLIKASGVHFEFRTTLYPSLTKEDLLKMAHLAKGSKWFLQQFQPKQALDPKARRLKPMNITEIKALLPELKEFAVVSIRGES